MTNFKALCKFSEKFDATTMTSKNLQSTYKRFSNLETLTGSLPRQPKKISIFFSQTIIFGLFCLCETSCLEDCSFNLQSTYK